jgi:hypothetical protein
MSKMSRFVLGLLIGLTVTGCAGKNSVAGSNKTKAEQLEATVPSWCESACKRLDDCNHGDSGCAADCEESMGRFTTGSDNCAAIGENFKRCVDGLSCADFDQSAKCVLSSTDEKLCPDADHEPSDEPPSAGGTSSQGDPGPGPGPGPSIGGAVGTAGTASGGAAGPDGHLVQCSSGYGTAGSGPGQPTSSAVVCEEGRESCNDGHAYSWICARGSAGQLGCTCFVDDQVTGGFDPGSSGCPSLTTVNSGCSWNLSP